VDDDQNQTSLSFIVCSPNILRLYKLQPTSFFAISQAASEALSISCISILWRTSFLLRIVRALFPEFALRHRPTESLIGVPRPVRSIVLNVAFCSYVKESWHPSAVGFPVIAKLIKYYWSTLATVPLNGSPSSIVEVIHIEECVWKIPSVQCRRHRK
jgi:hypothetical protein